MDFGLQFRKDDMGYTTCISITQFIFTIVIWSTVFTESVILDLIKVVVFFFGCAGACVVQLYNTNSSDSATKLLPCGMLVMISFSLFAVILIVMTIISKGFMDCVGEFIALMFGVVFTLVWTALYFATDRHVQLEYYDESGQPKQAAAEPSADPEA